jgi:hypothetical protein
VIHLGIPILHHHSKWPSKCHFPTISQTEQEKKKNESQKENEKATNKKKRGCTTEGGRVTEKVMLTEV